MLLSILPKCCGGPSSTSLPRDNVDLSEKISTVVLLVMENRSFDNMLGFLLRDYGHEYPGLDDETRGDFLAGHEFNSVGAQNSLEQTRVLITSNAPYVTEADPPHGFGSIRRQIYGTNSAEGPVTMSGFASEAETEKAGFSAQVMSCFDPPKIPITVTLAREFAVFTRWYASVPASTQPNRLYVHSATSNGAISNVTMDLVKGFPQKTIFESLEESRKSFKIYYQNVPATLFMSNLRSFKYLDNFKPYGNFLKDAKAGKLPSYAVIEQRYFDSRFAPANDNHPPHDVRRGEALIKEVYEAIRASPQWLKTLFLITYDEHGGLYDHKAPPSSGIPNPDGKLGPAPDHFNFDRLGVRVPTIAISPWIKRNTLVGDPTGPTPTSRFEHSSIAATLKKLYNLKSFLTRRDEWAGTFDTVLSLSAPRTDCPKTLPAAPAMSKDRKIQPDDSLHEWQEELVLLAYDLNGVTTGPDVPQTVEDVEKMMNSKQAADFVVTAVENYLKGA